MPNAACGVRLRSPEATHAGMLRRRWWALLAATAQGLHTTMRLTTEERMLQFGGMADARYFRQKLDHMDPTDERVRLPGEGVVCGKVEGIPTPQCFEGASISSHTQAFDQRYFVRNSYWTPSAQPNPPV